MSASSPLVRYAVQFVFLFTGVFSTCAAQYVFYQGAGDQRAMLLPLCNFLGLMLVGLVPLSGSSAASSAAPAKAKARSFEDASAPPSSPLRRAARSASAAAVDVDMDTDCADEPERTGLTRRPALNDDAPDSDLDTVASSPSLSPAALDKTAPAAASLRVWLAASPLQLCIALSVVLDFAGCIFSNMGLAMAGSGLYQVVYSSVICWSALLSRFVLHKVVSRDEWTGIALVTFGLAFSALGQSGGTSNDYVVLMGCFNTLLGAAFYGGNYVTGEYMLKLPERPAPQELCLKIGTACVGIVAVYQVWFVLPEWHVLVTKPIEEAHGSTRNILLALLAYTLSQLAHGLTYFLMLGSSGAVTTGIMQSLRAVCVFVISSVLYCHLQESQCFDTKRGVATLIVVCGVMFYSWAKSRAKTNLPATSASALASAAAVRRAKAAKLIAGKNFVV